MVCHLTWQSWENMICLLPSCEEEQLRKVVADPKAWRKYLPPTLCALSYDVPVYLGAIPGMVMVSDQACNEGHVMLRKRRQGNPLPRCKSHRMASGNGEARSEKDRLDLLARQGL